MPFRTDLLRRAVYEPVTEEFDMAVYFTGVSYFSLPENIPLSEGKTICHSYGCIAGNVVLNDWRANHPSLTLSEFMGASEWDWLTAKILEVDYNVIHPLFHTSEWPSHCIALYHSSWHGDSKIMAQIVEDFIEHYEAGRDWV